MFPYPEEWPAFRRTGNLQAHSPLSGNITTPNIAWKQFVGAWETLAVIEGSTKRSESLVAQDPSVTHSANLICFGDFAAAPVVNDENNIGETTFTHADVLPEYPGKERIEFESAFLKPMINGTYGTCIGRCLAKKSDRWVTVWETEPIPELFCPLPLVGDFDNDGAQEIAILPFYMMMLIDARTGIVKDTCQFTNNRNYGFAGVYDFNHDGLSEFLIQSDFSKHIDVLGFPDGKKLSLLWTQNIEMDTAQPRKIVQVAPEPTADVDGDGQVEVIATVFNDGGDHKWHLSFLDAFSGAKKFDFADELFAAALDVDGDGLPEILTTAANGSAPCDRIMVRSLKRGASRVLWDKEGANWETWEPSLPAHVKSMATHGRRTVLSRRVNGRLHVVLREDVAPSQHKLSVVHWSEKGFTSLTTVSGERLRGVGLDTQGRLLVTSRHHSDESPLSIASGRLAQQSTKRIGVESETAIVAWPKGADIPTIVVQGALGEQVAFQPPNSADEMRCRYIPGYGQRIPVRRQGQSYPESLGPVIADLAGDGNRQLIVADVGDGGCGSLSVKDLRGKVLWRHQFADIAGVNSSANTGGVILWQAGYFRDSSRQDVLVTVQRSMTGSEETCLLSGDDGSLIWRRDQQINRRGVGGNPFAIADFDGDGLEDAASLWPNLVYILRGKNGEDILAIEAQWKQVYNKPVYFGQAVAGSFLGNGKNSLFFTGRLMTGVIRSDGELQWFDALDKSAPHLPAFGDFDGDGKIEMIGAGFEDGVRCYDTVSGKIKWRMPNPTAPDRGFGTLSPSPVQGTASADLDGDGRDEALLSIGHELLCVASTDGGSAGEECWRVEFPSQIGPPIVAQLARNAGACILVVGKDGNVYCLR